MKCCTKLDVVYKRCPNVFQGHPSNFKVTRLKEIVDFDPNWVFPDSSLNSPMAMKWCTKLEAAWESIHIVFQGYPSNFKVAWDKKLPILTQIERFRTETPVWIQWWLWNDAQSLKHHRRGAVLYFKVNRQISRSQGTKNSSILARIGRFRTVTPVWIHWWFWNDAQSVT